MQTIIAPFMKLMNEIRSEYASVPENDHGLESHIFRLTTLIISLLAFLILIPSNLLQGISYLVSVPTALCGGVSFALYLAARKGSNHVNAMLVMMLGTINASWFLDRGSEGSVPYFFFPVCMYPLIFYHGWKRGLILAGIIANGCMLIALSHLYPWIVTPYESGFDRTLDLMVGMISCSVCIALVVWVVLITYMREQERLKVLNLKLEQEVDGRMRTEDELLRSNKDLAATEEKFRTVADYTVNWEFWIGPDGEFIYTSPSCEKITGYDARAFYSDPGLKERIIHPEDRKLFDGHYHGPDSENGAKSLTFRINHADGSTRWIEHICRPILDANGVYQGIRGSNRDITGRKETEEALKRSEERFRTIFNSSADPIIMRDQNFSIIEVNDVACQRLGYSREDFLRMDYLDIFSEKDPGRLMELLEKIHSTGQVTYESSLATADGREIPVEVIAKTINFEGRNLILSISRDITERKRGENVLRESEERFRTLTEKSPVGIYIIQDDLFRYVNPAFAAMHGCAPEEIIDRLGPVDFLTPEDRDRLLDSIRRRTTGEIDFAHHEFHIRRKDGSIRIVEVFSSRALHHGRPAALGTIIDVTERKHSEEKLFQVTERWERTFDAVPDLIAIIDNDFRIVQANKAMADRLGVTPAECAGQLCYLAVHKTGAPHSFCPHAQTLNDCHEHMAEVSEEGLGGHFLVSTSPIYDSAGQLMGSVHVARDITSRKETEEELRRSEERYRRIVDTAKEGIWVIGPDTETILVNTRMAEMLGYSRTEMIGRPYTDFMFEEDLADHLKQMDNRRRGISEAYERRFRRIDGQAVWTHASATPLFDDEQHFNGSFGMFTDITERKRAEGRLAELNECFLHFGADSDRNIDRLVQLYGEQVGAACAVYSRLEGGDLLPVSTWNTPADFSKAPHSPGQICHDVFHGFKDQVIVIEDLQQSGFMNTDPKVSRYGIRTYTGRTVSFCGTETGLLCAVYIDDRTPGEEDKKLLGIIASAIGVEEERKRALAALKESEATLRSITGSARDAIIMIDSEGRTSFWNETATLLFGWNEAQALGNDLHALIMPARYHDAFSREIKRFAATGTGNAVGRTLELQVMRRDGSEVPVEVSLSAVQIKGKWNAVGIIRDITERKKAEAEIEHMAYHDALTGLPNRFLLDDRLNQTIALAGRTGRMTAVLFFDLDNFKSINDSFGHPVGDMLLMMVVERLGQRLRKSDTIARMGGDEFIVILSDILAPEDAAQAARIFLEAFSEPFQLVGQEIYTSASVGISLYPIDGANTATLLKNADIAMYQAKKHGRNSFQFFTKEINQRAEERLLLENELRHAVNKGEFILHYQPWIDLKTGFVGGMEALIRWVHPQRGIIPPNSFIPIAEETGLIIPIGEWVMKNACLFLEELHRKGLNRLTMSVNVSGKQLRNPNLIGLLGLLLADAVFDPSRLELELTESSVMENLEESRRYMDALKMTGVCLALDDFGTGYSSLSYLKRFPLDRLKIDRSFVKDCPDNPDDVAIARAIIALARTLNLQVTAEGVENLAQADFFSREKCDVIQGHLICKPMPGNDLLHLLCG
jgi:diguanylate cyclase (GGDEF)-like protein/PAS domain S-box-containing protein